MSFTHNQTLLEAHGMFVNAVKLKSELKMTCTKRFLPPKRALFFQTVNSYLKINNELNDNQ